MKIENISWDEETVLLIARHSVSPEEVEEVLFNDDARMIDIFFFRYYTSG